jgi:hypothetical protein
VEGQRSVFLSFNPTKDAGTVGASSAHCQPSARNYSDWRGSIAHGYSGMLEAGYDQSTRLSCATDCVVISVLGIDTDLIRVGRLGQAR